MFNKKFTVSGSSLELLKAGEQGIVTRCRNVDKVTREKLTAMGIQPGIAITLEQRQPEFIITAGKARLTLNQEVSRSIYVRITPANQF